MSHFAFFFVKKIILKSGYSVLKIKRAFSIFFFSVIGLNFDFLVYNFSGFLAYGLFNVGMYWIPVVKVSCNHCRFVVLCLCLQTVIDRLLLF